MEITLYDIKFTFRDVAVPQLIKYLLTDRSSEAGKITLLEFCETAFDVNNLKFLKHSTKSVHETNNEIANAIAVLKNHAGITIKGGVSV